MQTAGRVSLAPSGKLRSCAVPGRYAFLTCLAVSGWAHSLPSLLSPADTAAYYILTSPGLLQLSVLFVCTVGLSWELHKLLQ